MWRQAICIVLMSASAARGATVVVDCRGRSAEPPLGKSFVGVYQTPFWFKSHPPDGPDGRRLADLLGEAGLHHFRYELAWGKPDAFAPDMVAADAHGRPVLDAAVLAPFLHRLADAGVTPLLSLSYCPTPLQHGPPGWQRWKAEPADLAGWSAVCRQAAERWAFCHPQFEVWNEPDLPGDGGKVFFAGGPAAYGRVYAAAADAVGPAPVGGPAIAYDAAYLARSGILDRRITFASVHAYANAHGQLAAVRAALAGRKLPIRLTEYASYADAALPDSSHGHAAAAAFLADVKRLLAEPGLDRVYWAQWVDDSIGLVDERLHRRALFNAVLAYQTLLPTDRRPVRADGGLDAMAATDDAAAAVAVWNPTDRPIDMAVTLAHPPAAAGIVSAYRIDARHASHGDDPATERLTAERSPYRGDATWAGPLPARSVVIVRASAS